MHIQNLVKIYQFVLKVLSGNKLLAFIKSHSFGTNVRKMTGNNPNLDLVNINVNTKHGEILSICSEDMTDRQNDGQPKSSIAPTFSKRGYKYIRFNSFLP